MYCISVSPRRLDPEATHPLSLEFRLQLPVVIACASNKDTDPSPTQRIVRYDAVKCDAMQ